MCEVSSENDQVYLAFEENGTSEGSVHQHKDDGLPLSPSVDKDVGALQSVASSVAIVGLVTFVGDCARGILFPVLWPLCQALGGSKSDYGFLVSIFSVGRLVITTRMGIISDVYRHRAALLLSAAILFLGAALWSNVQFLGSLALLYVAQFMLGLGTGSLGVTRSYVAEQVAPARRTYMLARLSALQYAGFAATPLLGSALVIAGGAISTTWEYALPGYLVLFLALLCLGLLIYPFQDIKKMYVHKGENVASPSSGASDAKSKDVVIESGVNPLTLHATTGYEKQMNRADSSQHDIENPGSATLITPLTSPMPQSREVDTKPEINFRVEAHDQNERIKNRVFMLMMFLNFTTRGGIAVYETQGSQILLDQYNVSQWELGLLVSCAGAIGTVQLIYFKQFWTKHFSDMTLMIGGLILFSVAQLLVINWGPDRTTPMWQYVVSMYLIYAVAYPIANSAVLGVFSSLQKAGKQAKAQGQFAFMGSLARVVMPIATGYLEQYLEYSSSFSMVLVLISLSLVGVALLYHEIVFFSSATLTSYALFDSQDPKHTLSVGNWVIIVMSGTLAVLGLLAAFDFGVPGW